MTPFFWLKENADFQINTIIKQSTIDGAGKGRFTLEKINKGDLIKKTTIIHIKDYLNILKSNENNDTNYFIILNNYDDINMLFEYFKSFKLLNEEEIKIKMSWFIGHINNKLYIQSHSNYYNHSVNCNIEYRFDDKYLYQYANKDIDKDSELFIDYNNIKFTDYYLKWCCDNNIDDVLSYL